MFENRAKYLLILAMAVVFVRWSSTPVAAEQREPQAFVLPYASWQTPKTAEEYNNRGLDRQNSGDLDGAIADYTKALSLKAKPAIQATIYNNRANAFIAKNDLAAAITDYSSAIQLQPSEFENYFNRGIALYNKRDLDAAVADFSKVIEFEPRFARAYNERGNVRSDKGDAEGSIADYSTAITLSPQDVASTTTAELHCKTNVKTDAAINDFFGSFEAKS